MDPATEAHLNAKIIPVKGMDMRDLRQVVLNSGLVGWNTRDRAQFIKRLGLNPHSYPLLESAANEDWLHQFLTQLEPMGARCLFAKIRGIAPSQTQEELDKLLDRLEIRQGE